MSMAARVRARRMREWAAALTPLQRRLFDVLARDMIGSLYRRGLIPEVRDLQRRIDAIRKVERLK